MKHTSKRFGEFEYDEDSVITIEGGLKGFKHFTKFVIKENPDTKPLLWLLSVEEDGPELPVVIPGQIDSKFAIETDSNTITLCIVTIPKNIKFTSMDLKAPIFIELDKRIGVQEIIEEGKTAKHLIYNYLFKDDDQEEISGVVLARKENEYIEIGDDISITILELNDNRAKIIVNAPRSTTIWRGDQPSTPTGQTKLANEDIDMNQLRKLLSRK